MACHGRRVPALPTHSDLIVERIDLANDLSISRIGLGTWAIGGWMWGGTDVGEAIQTIRGAVDRGVTLIDTAPVYGFGRSEEIVGEALASGGLRKRVRIATKAGLNWQGGTPFRDSRPVRIRQEIDDSLRRLRTDYIDIYQIHWPDPNTPLGETAGVLEELYDEGKIRAIGVSNFSPQQMNDFRAAISIETVQSPYNLFEREIEKDVQPYAEATDLVVLCYGALCRGLLSGRMTADRVFTGDDLRKLDPKFQPTHLPHYLAAVAELETFARAHFGKSVLALALRWVLDKGPNVALWGARRPDQLDPLDEIEGWTIDEAAMSGIDGILERHVSRPIAPDFMAPPARQPVSA
jgi:aryl-alcohol dehydrogenase-like predicted oxidoreductase